MTLTHSLATASTFAVPFSGRHLHANTLPGESALHLFAIHGGGAGNINIFSGLRHALLEHDIGSTAFDCIGHGRTGGAFAESSLLSRQQQAMSVIRHANIAPSTVLGISMGAYNAIRLSEMLPLQSLILVVPGIYTPEALNVPFGPAFSDIIRQPRSWADSDAWEILGRFRGRLLVIAAEKDGVIPLEIPERLYASATSASERELLVIPDAEHRGLLPIVLARPQWRDAVMNNVMRALPERQ
ncbi:alpha/beta hydrolase [Diaphorobacter sp. HDW4B]|nr:alpha/beta hydrolase [Diaphorobacter sp. HDW4B]